MQELEPGEARKAARLIAGFISHRLTAEQSKELDEWIGESDAHMQLFEQLTDPENQEWASAWFSKIDRSAEVAIAKNIHRRSVIRRLTIPAAAASLIILGGLGLRFYFQRQQADLTPPPAAANPASKYRMVSLLHTGDSIIDLSHSTDSMLTTGAHSIISRRASQLNYSAALLNDSAINILETAAGEYYHIMLSDGSGVWLNTLSSLRYPVHFSQTERMVELSGEGFFQIAKDADRPFRVQTGDTKITVLGTSFNISGYPEDTMKTVSVLQGAVRLERNAPPTMLVAGQRAAVGRTRTVVWMPTNIEQCMTWTKDAFDFQKTPVRDVMQTIARWYAMDVIYQDNIDLQFTGRILRNARLSDVLDMIRLSGGIRFSVKDRTIVVRR